MARRTGDHNRGNSPPASPDDTPAKPATGKDPLAAELGRRGGLKGGKARAAKLSPERRRAIARKAAALRWARTRGEVDGEETPPPRPEGMAAAAGRGTIRLADHSLECFRFDDGRRMVGLWSAASAIADTDPTEFAKLLEGQGVPMSVATFNVPGDWRLWRGLDAQTFVAICRALLTAAPSTGGKPGLVDRCQQLLADCALDGLQPMIDQASAEPTTDSLS